ncbi:MAG: DegT/DnrJ/EryC1/StrS family aminotransferase [Pseudomonadota bacterium]
MDVPFYSLQRMHASLQGELQNAINGVLASGHFLLGEPLAEFEQAFATFCGTRHCLGVGNGLDSLTLAMLSLDIGPGDTVAVPANVFIAVAIAVARVGATPLLVDVCPDTRNLDVDSLRLALRKDTRAIVVVHQYGTLAEMDAILDLAHAKGLYVVEDASQAHGAMANSRRAGSFGDIACLSFYPSKNLGALGDGGAVLTCNDQLAERVRRLRNYGMNDDRQPLEAGINSRLDDIQAACLRIKLSHLDTWNQRRRQIAATYQSELADLPGLTLPTNHDEAASVWHLFVVCCNKRDALRRTLDERGIGTAVHYPYALHQTAACVGAEISPGGLSVSEALAETCLSLPIAPYLSTDEALQVSRCVREALDVLS